MKPMFASALLLLASTANAADVALILNDQEQAALRRILDAATKHDGMNIARMTVHIENRLNTAPAVTEQKTEPPKPKEPQQ